MSVLSVTCCSLLSAVCAFTLVTSSGCGTDARGVDECRDIEQTRCSAAQSCGVVTDVAACQRFYRDQCLHGLSVASPGAAKVKACVDTIRAAGSCAAQLSTAAEPPEGCTTTEDACALVSNPELSEACSFLAPNADAGTAGNGGTGGASAGGEAGAAGSAGEAGG